MAKYLKASLVPLVLEEARAGTGHSEIKLIKIYQSSVHRKQRGLGLGCLKAKLIRLCRFLVFNQLTHLVISLRRRAMMHARHVPTTRFPERIILLTCNTFIIIQTQDRIELTSIANK